MPLPFEMHQVGDEQDLSQLLSFMSVTPLDYGSHSEWLHDKIVPRITSGSALAIVGRYEGMIIADAVLYPFMETETVEVKNFRVAESASDEGVGSFLWRQAEVLGCAALGLSDPSQSANLRLDTRTTNTTALRFFMSQGCSVIDHRSLYEADKVDIILGKAIRAPRRQASR